MSFDINDFIGDGIWWLQIYNNKYNLIYDAPFASSRDNLKLQKIKEIIKQEIIKYKGTLL